MVAATAPRSSDDRIPTLTGLRGVAALLVALMHLWQFAGQPSWHLGPLDLTPFAIGGYLGVDLFFVLSGFLLGMPFVRARMQTQAAPSLKSFWTRRVRRVLPALWAQIAILFVVGWMLAGAPPAGVLDLLAQATLTFNLFDGATLNPVYWSLPIEWDFYLVLPLLALTFARGSGRPWGLVPVLLFVLMVRVGCVWAVQVWGVEGIEYARWIAQLPSRLDQFVLGMVGAWIVLRAPPPPRLGVMMAWSGVTLVLLLMWSTAPLGDVIGGLRVPRVYWHYSAVGVAFALLVVGATLGAGPVLQTTLASAPLGFVGRISYSMYLWHYPVLEAMRALDATARIGSTTIAWWLVAPIAIVVVSWLSYRCVERPFLRAAVRDLSDPRCDTPAVSSLPRHS